MNWVVLVRYKDEIAPGFIGAEFTGTRLGGHLFFGTEESR